MNTIPENAAIRANQTVDFYTAPMNDGDIDTLASLLVRHHNSITEKNCSFYGVKMDKALCRDTLSTLYTRAGMYDKLLEIQSHFKEAA